METLFATLNEDGSIAILQRVEFDGSSVITTSDAEYKTWFDAQMPWVQTGWPSPGV